MLAHYKLTLYKDKLKFPVKTNREMKCTFVEMLESKSYVKKNPINKPVWEMYSSITLIQGQEETFEMLNSLK